MDRQERAAFAVIAVIVSVILAVATLALSTTGYMMGGGGMMGGGNGTPALAIILLTVLLVFGLIVIIILSRPLSESPPLQPIQFLTQPPIPSAPPMTTALDEHDVSRMLNGDERQLYQIVASSGGSILQRDIVSKNVFSKAKVTRLLDKLEEKGVVVRERNGMTNLIRIKKG